MVIRSRTSIRDVFWLPIKSQVKGSGQTCEIYDRTAQTDIRARQSARQYEHRNRRSRGVPPEHPELVWRSGYCSGLKPETFLLSFALYSFGLYQRKNGKHS